jgi:hypothetical protein
MDNTLFIGRFDESMIQNSAEFSKRYLDSWIYNETEKKAVYIKKINEVAVELLDCSHREETISLYTDTVFSNRSPTLGFFNMKRGFGYGIRVPARQFKRGICTQNYNPVNSLDTLVRKELITFNLSTALNFAYEEHKNCILDVIEELNSTDTIGRILNKDFAVSLNTFSPENLYLLWYKNTPVGEIYPDNKIIRVKYKHVKQEVMDYNKYIENRQWKIL